LGHRQKRTYYINSVSTSNTAVGVVGFSSNNVGVYGATTNPDPSAYAGVFQGNLLVTGRIDAGTKDAMVPLPRLYSS
jgi:hypothetical protein